MGNKNKYGYVVILSVCDEMNGFDLYQMAEYIYNFNFSIMKVWENLYCSSAFDCDFDLRISIIEHENKLVYLEMVR